MPLLLSPNRGLRRLRREKLEESRSDFCAFLIAEGLSYHILSPEEINRTPLLDRYRGIFFPGGDADDFNRELNARGVRHIRELVLNGGAYVGVCAGAEFACDRLIWRNGYEADYPLDLFAGRAEGPFDGIAPYPDWAYATIRLAPEHPLNADSPDQRSMLYYGGTAFYPDPDSAAAPLAAYDEPGSPSAALTLSAGKGKVLLIGPHPEIKRGAEFAAADPDGDEWPWLAKGVRWALE